MAFFFIYGDNVHSTVNFREKNQRNQFRIYEVI